MPAAIASRFAPPVLRIRSGSDRFRVELAVVAATALGGVVVDGRDLSWQSALDAAAGVALAGCGVTLINRFPARLTGHLFMAASVAWFAGTLLPALGTPGSVGTVMVLTLHRGPLVHGILAVPRRRTRASFGVAVVAAAWITGIVTPLARLDAASLVVGASIFAVALRFVRKDGREPLARTAVVSAGAYGAALAVPAALRLGSIGNDRAAIAVYMVVVIGVSIALAFAAHSARESTVLALAIDLGDRPDGSTLRRALARAVGDPDLAVGIWLEDEQRYVDDLGHTLVGNHSESSTPLVVAGRRVGSLFHAPSTSYEAGIVEDAAGVAALAVENARLHADSQRGLEELSAARRRIVEQTHEQRRLIGEQIRHGADRHLEAAENLLRGVAEALPDASLLDDLAEARASILSLATGLDTSLPSEDRLRAAAERRTARSAIPIELQFERIDLSDQWQHALLLVFAEAVANAVKHSGCTCISCRLQTIPGGVRMEITDDGVGGADPGGFGVSGLRDRVGALGGSVDVVSPPGGGTTIRATLPTGAVTDAEPS